MELTKPPFLHFRWKKMKKINCLEALSQEGNYPPNTKFTMKVHIRDRLDRLYNFRNE